ncbi:TPA: TIM barrel protein [Streptococcus suis]
MIVIIIESKYSEEKMISINLDEFQGTIYDTCKTLNYFGISECEVRLVNGINIGLISAENCLKIKEILSSFNIRVNVIASPIFKWCLLESSNTNCNMKKIDTYGIDVNISRLEKDKLIHNVLSNAKILGTNKIRIFSGVDCDVITFLKSQEFKNLIEKNPDFEFLIENEITCSIKKMNDLFVAVEYINKHGYNNVKLLFDVANATIADKSFNFNQLYLIKEKIDYFHFKNYKDKNGSFDFVSLGEGDLDYKYIIDFVQTNFSLCKMCVETDIWDPNMRQKEAVESLKFLIKNYQGCASE